MADSYTELEKAVVVLVENFYKYVSKHSLVKNKISKSSFRKMLQKELNHMLTVRFPPPKGLAFLTPTPPQPPKPCPLWVSFPTASSVLSELPLTPNQGLNSTQASVFSVPRPEPVRALFPFSKGLGSFLGLL